VLLSSEIALFLKVQFFSSVSAVRVYDRTEFLAEAALHRSSVAEEDLDEDNRDIYRFHDEDDDNLLPPPDDDNLSDGAVFGDSSGDVHESTSKSEDVRISHGLYALTESAESVYNDTDSDGVSVNDAHPPLSDISDIDVDNADNSDFADTQSGLSSLSQQPSAAFSMSELEGKKKRKRYLTADRTIATVTFPASAASLGEGSDDGGGSSRQRRRGKEGEKEVFYGRIKRAYKKKD
jgi:hypothetical protein